jgi:hypothetical protein
VGVKTLSQDLNGLPTILRNAAATGAEIFPYASPLGLSEHRIKQYQ